MNVISSTGRRINRHPQRRSAATHLTRLTLLLVSIALWSSAVWTQPRVSYANPQASTCVTLKPAKNAGFDSYIKSNSATNNYGGDSRIEVKTKVTSGGQIDELKRGVIRFDLSSIPVNSIIDSASLKLAVDTAPSAGDGGLNISVHRLTTAWNESTVTWNSPWSTPGGNFIATAITTQNIDSNDKFSSLGDQPVSFDVTSGVAFFMQNPTSNYGFLLKGPDTLTGKLDREVKFWSNDESNADKQPALEVCYSPGIVLAPSNAAQAAPGDTVVYPHTLTIGDLAGTANETIALAISSSAGLPSTAYVDNGTVGVYEPGTDTQITGPVSLPQNSTTNVLIVTQVPANTPDGTIDQTTITATGSPSGIVASAVNTTSVGVPPFTEPVVDGKLDTAYLTNPDTVIQEYCADPSTGLSGQVLARTFATYDLNNAQSNNVYIVLEMDLAMVDNTYGAPPSLHPSWTAAGKSHSLSSLVGSDEAEFSLFGANGSLVASPIIDYSGGATSGYHPDYIDNVTTQQAAQIVAKTSLGYNFTTLGYSNTNNSPALTATQPTDPYIPVDSQFNNWQFVYLYELSIDKAFFTSAGGFGRVSIPYTHVSPNKLGSNVIDAVPCDGSIGDRVWYDRNQDGMQDAGEPGLNGVRVELFADNGDGVFNATTDYPRGSHITSGDGDYLFSGLGPGKFWVNVVDTTVPAGFFITTNNDPFGPINLAADQDFLNADFGYTTEPEVSIVKNVISNSPAVVGGNVDYEIIVTNTGQTAIATLPLSDHYDAGKLMYDTMLLGPTPDSAGGGTISWSNILVPPDQLLPTESVTLRVRFKALSVTEGATTRDTTAAVATLATVLDFPTFTTETGGRAPEAAGSCTAPFNNNVYVNTSNCKCEKPTQMTVRYTGTGPTTITIGGNGSGGPFTNVNTGDTFTISVTGNEPTFTAGTGGSGGTQAIHTSCSSPLYPGWSSRPVGQDKFTQGGPYEVVSFNTNGVPFVMADPAKCTLGSIGDRVIVGTTVPDNGSEPGVSGVTVNLYGGSCPADPADLTPASRLKTTTTNANGVYDFTGLIPGEYCVAVDNGTLPVIYTLGTDSPLDAASQGNDVNTCDFGVELVGTGSIGDRVFYDLNGDGLPDDDANEPGLNGVTVNLSLNGQPFGSTTTSVNGNYLFTNLPAGTYTVDVVNSSVPAGLSLTTGNDPQTVVLADGQNFRDADFGYIGDCNTAFIGGAKDVNGSDIPSVADGAACAIIAPATIGNYVWIDEDSDGYQDAGEPGLANVTVELFEGNTLVATEITDSNGGYLFTGLRPGTYTVQVDAGTLPAGATQTTNPVLPGADFGNQSQPYSVTVTAGQENLTADFGYNWGDPTNPPQGAKGAIGDRVWVDTDGDGFQDAGEPGLGNIPVTIYWDSNGDGQVQPGVDQPFTGAVDQNGNTGTGTTTTNPDGFYIFSQLPPGSYVIVVNNGTTPAGYTQTGDPDDYGVPATNPDNRTTSPIVLAPGDVFLLADFGYRPPVNGSNNNTIGDRVWLDSDADGVQDANEPGINGVTVALLDVNDVVIATDTTDASGLYLFTGLPDGTYTVMVTDSNNVLGTLQQTGDPDATLDGMSTVTNLGVGNPNPVSNLNQDFGYTPNGNQPGDGVIGDTIFLNINGNATQDAGEPGIEGVVVELFSDINGDGAVNGGDTLLATAITNENGNYFFGGIDPNGQYTVRVAASNFAANGALEGLANTADPDGGNNSRSGVNLGAPGTDGNADPDGLDNGINLGQDFGYTVSNGTLVRQIGNLIWKDTNANGIYEPANGETPIGGVTVDLYRDLNGDGLVNPGEPLYGSTTSSATINAGSFGTNGNYIFNGLPADRYVVDVTDVNGVLGGYWQSLGAQAQTTDNTSKVDPFAVDVTSASRLTADFGYYVDLASVGDFIFEDVNNNGLQDGGEPGIPGVVVTLTITYPNGDVTVLTTVSDANGAYSFDGLLGDEDFNGIGTPATPGVGGGDEPAFIVTAEVPANAIPAPINVGANDAIDSDDPINGEQANPVQGSADNTNDFGFVQEATAAIGNYVWIDENSDGYQDAGEPGLPNVTVELRDGNGALLATTQTDTNGGYLFANLIPGTYRVQVDATTLPAGATQTTNPVLPGADFGNQSQPYSVTLAPGQENLTADFGYNWGNPNNPPQGATGAIGDRVWVDEDGDGKQDDGEPGLGNIPVTIYWDSNGDGVVDPNVDQPFTGAVDQNGNTGTGTTTTEPDGSYIFSNLPAGQYVVVVNNGTTPTGYTQTGDPDDFGQPATNPDNQTTTPIVLAPGDVYLNADFGYQPPANGGNNNSLGDLVWLDQDADGVRDPLESGIAGVTLALLDSNGNIIATTTTNAAGFYEFVGLPDGIYTVRVTDTNAVLTALEQTGDPDATLDGAGTTDLDSFGLNPAPVNDPTLDFGYTPRNHQPGRGLIGDTVFIDRNANNVYNPGEEVEGVVVELRDNSNNLIATTTTDENGNYYFGDLNPTATYRVTIAASNFAAGGVLQGTLNTVDPDNAPGSGDNTSLVNLGAPGNDGNADPDGTDNGVNLGQDFGYRPGVGQSGIIGNLIWNDTNANGVYEAGLGETPIGGVTVDIYRDLNGNGVVDAGDPKVGSTTSAAAISAQFGADGNYLFSNLPFGNYVVDVTDNAGVLAGFWQSLGAANTNNNSQVDPDAAAISAGGTSNLRSDFGYYVEPASVGDFVFDDLDGDGIQDVGEPGLPGVVVTLTITYPNGDVTVLTTVSDANGAYSFDNLLSDEDYNGIGTPATPGVGGGDEPAHVVTAQVPTGYVPTDINVGGNDAIDSDDPLNGELASPVQGGSDDTNDFGFDVLYTLGNQVWADQNGGTQGIKDANEPGIPGVTVQLYRDSDGTPGVSLGDTFIGTRTTDGNGFYSFSGLQPGNYYVVIPSSNLEPGGALATFNGPTTFAANPNNNVDNDNNGQIQQIGVSIAVVSNPITLGGRAEPSGNGTINNTLDFGFVQGGQTAVTLSALNTSAATRNVALLPLLVALLGVATLPLVTRRRTL